MSTTIGDLAVRVGADTTGLVRGLNQASSKMDDFGAKMRSGAADFAKYGAAAAAAGSALVAGLAVKGLAAVDAQAKLAKSLSTTSSSLATLERAGELSGVAMSQLEQATKDFTRRLSQAADGAGPAKEALDRLNLSALELSEMPLDERIATVNKAIRDFVPAAQQAAVAGQLFGEEGSIAMQRISPETISQAAREAKIFGTNLSEIDAAMVEQANDAMSTFALALDGVSKRLAIELAPILTAVGRMFTDAAEEAGGFGEAVSDSFGFVVDASAFVLDAVAGIKRVFEVVADGIIAAWSGMAGMVASHIENLLSVVAKIPGMGDIMEGPLESVRNFAEESTEVARLAVDNIHNTLMEPLPGNQFKEFVAQARQAAEEAAQETVNLKDMLIGGDSAQAGGGNTEEAEKHKEEIQARLERIMQGHMSEMELIHQKYALEHEALREALELELVTRGEYDDLMREQEMRQQEELSRIEQEAARERQRIVEAEAKHKQQAFGDALSNMTTLMNTGSRKMFEIGKAAAIGNSLLNAYEAITGAYKVGANIGGPVLGAAYAAAAGAAQFAQIQSIRGQSFGGGGGASGSVTQAVNDNSAPVGGAGVQQQQQNLTANLTLEGQSFSRRDVIGLIGQINELQEDGMRVRILTS